MERDAVPQQLTIVPYSDQAAWAVLQRVDPNDMAEVAVTLGEATSPLSLFANWRIMQSAAHQSWIVLDGIGPAARPFALIGLFQTGTQGMASAALLAANHRLNRAALIKLAAELRRELPRVARRLGIHRIETRCWTGHPSAARLLAFLGFKMEALCPGFGEAGQEVLLQFALLIPPKAPPDPDPRPTPNQDTLH